jgi:hypothetical protein
LDQGDDHGSNEHKFKRVNLTRLPEEKKRQAWERLKRDYPDQAAWVMEPLVQELLEHFNAEIVIHIPEKSNAKGN